MNQKKGKQNGCREQTKNADEGISADIEALREYVCDELCWFREEMKGNDLVDRICRRCALQQYTENIRKKYEEKE